MSKQLRMLHVEDSQDDADLLLHALKSAGYEVISKRVDNAEAMRASLASDDWELVVSDFSMPNFSGLAALSLLREMKADLPFILVSGTVGEEVAVTAMKAGANDYIMKDKLMRLAPAVQRELSEAENRVLLRAKDEQLRQAQKMEIVGQFAGGIAHDFNNVLAVILMYCDSILGKVAASDPVHAEVELIKKSGRSAAALTRQLLTFSRKQVLEPRVLDLNLLVSNMTDMLGTLIGEHIHLSSELHPELGRVKADPGQMEQVLMNLAVNARDAMPKGGKLQLQTRNAGEAIELCVSDTGSGMDAATQSRIFEPFFTTKGPGKGTGLGLSTVSSIVRQCGGKISVESQVGRGASFKVSLPRVDQKSAPEPVAAAARVSPAQAGGKILLMEDDSSLRGVVGRCLEKAGYDVTAPRTADEAAALIAKGDCGIDLLLTDVVMPQLSGPELATRLLAARPRAKVLFVSGFPGETLEEFGADGRASFLQKPFSSDELLRKILEVMGRGGARE